MKKFFLIALVTIVVLGVAAALLLPRLVDANRYRPAIEQAISSATGRSVKIGALRLRLLPAPGLAAAGITVGEDPLFGTEPFLKADALEVRLRLLPILAGRISVASLTVESPRLRLKRNRESRWSLASLASGAAGQPAGAPRTAGTPASPPPAAGGPSSGGVSFSVSRLRLANGSVTFVDEGLARGREQTFEAHDIDLTISDLSTTSPVGVDLALEIAGSGRAHLSGSVGPPPATDAPAAWPMEARLELDRFKGGPMTPYIAHFTGVRVHGGVIDLDVTVKGRAPESLDVAGSAKLTALEIDPLSGLGERVRLDGTVSLEGTVSPDRTSLSRCEVRTGDSTVSITGALSDLRRRPRLEARLATKRASVKDVAPVLRLVGPILPPGLAMKGEIVLDAAVKGHLDEPQRMALEGGATIAGLEFADSSLRQPITGISGTLVLKGDRAEIAGFTAALGRSRVTGGCTISRFEHPILDVRLAAPLLDIDELLTLLAPAPERAGAAAIGEVLRAARSAADPEAAAESVWTAARAPGEPPRVIPASRQAVAAGSPSLLREVVVRGEVGAEEIKVLNLKLTQAKARLAMEGGTARLEEVTVGLYGGALGGAATAGLFEAGLPFALSAQLRGVDFNPLVSDFSPDLKNLVHGTLEARLDVEGRGLARQDLKRNLTGNGSLALRDGRLTSFGFLKLLAKGLEAAGGRGIGRDETPFTSLTGTFDVAKGRARTEDLKLDSADIDMKGKGIVTLDLALDLDVRARVSQPVSADMVAKTANLRYLLDDRGRLSVDCRLGGSLMEPAVGIDPEMLRRAAKAAAKEQVEQKGQDLLQKILRKKKKKN